MLKLKTYTFVSDEDLAKLTAEQERPKPRWRTITIDDWDRGKKQRRAKLLEADYLVVNWEGGWEGHYLLSDDKQTVLQEESCERKREHVERRKDGVLIRIPRYC